MNRKIKIPMHGEERRKHKRYAVEMTRVEVSGSTTSLSGSVDATPRDFSERGIGVHSREPLHTGEKVNLRIHIPKKKKPLLFKGKVKWTERRGSGYKAGIRLLKGDSRSVEITRKLCQRLEEGPVWKRITNSLNPRRWSKTTLRRGALIAVTAGAIIVIGILSLPRIGNIAHAKNIRKYSTKKLECPLCRNVSYSTEYNLIDLPEELNEKKLVACPKCHEHVSYFDLEEAKREP